MMVAAAEVAQVRVCVCAHEREKDLRGSLVALWACIGEAGGVLCLAPFLYPCIHELIKH